MTGDRPELHITPPQGWLNDPNGLAHWNGRHHVFHQFDENSLWFGRMTWGHVSSDDLVHWQRHPVALAPGDGPDRDGVWSGCVVDDGGVATAIYTGIVNREDGSRIQSVCLATSTDPDLVEWVKSPDNPVAVDPPEFAVDAFRDPYVWREADGWAMLLGTGLPDGHGGVFLYRSADLRAWRYHGVFLGGADLPPEAPWAGAVWECPNLVIVDPTTALLLVSVHDPTTMSLHYTVALVGKIEDDRFVPTSAQRLDHGHNSYATAIEKTSDGRVLAYGWAWEGLSPQDREEQGWAGCLTVPRELGVRDRTVAVSPARELGPAFSVIETLTETTIAPASPVEMVLPRVARLDTTLRLDHTSVLRITLRRSPGSGEHLALDYSASRGSIVVDRSGASSRPGVHGGVSTAAYSLPEDGRLDLTVIVDHTIVEIFVGGVVAFSERIYPRAGDADELRIESRAETLGEKPASFLLEKLTVAQLDALG